jgi:hypothetical protein
MELSLSGVNSVLRSERLRHIGLPAPGKNHAARGVAQHDRCSEIVGDARR